MFVRFCQFACWCEEDVSRGRKGGRHREPQNMHVRTLTESDVESTCAHEVTSWTTLEFSVSSGFFSQVKLYEYTEHVKEHFFNVCVQEPTLEL